MSEEIKLTTVGDADVLQYIPEGVCSKLMQIRIKNNIIEDIEIVGGCNGNLQGISALVKGQNINDVYTKLDGIQCGSKGTSCPDQLSKALKAYLNIKKEALRV